MAGGQEPREVRISDAAQAPEALVRPSELLAQLGRVLQQRDTQGPACEDGEDAG
jgi:hypothetical protein